MSDLIERGDAIGACAYETLECYEARNAIRNLPSADRPRGEWIYTNNPLRLDDEWACNRCGNISFVKTNFCDRCGARMKGADDE